MMQPLSEVMQRFLSSIESMPDDARFIPDDGICEHCDRLAVNHEGVERLLALRGLKYYDDKTNRVVSQGIPYCRCERNATAERNAKASKYLLNARSSNLPWSVRGSSPREFVAGTIANFENQPGTEEALETVLDFTVGNTEPIVTFVGPPGSGKTHLLEAIGRQFLDQGMTVRYELVAGLLDRVRRSYNVGMESSVMEVCYDAHVLLLDDLGLEKPSDWVREQITALVDDRYRYGKLLAVATNESHVAIEDKLGARLVSRLFDRNSGKARVVYLTAEDYRST